MSEPPVCSTPAAPVFQPCFIVGCERSGTTLLAVLLDRHSQIAITPETHFLSLVPRRMPHSPLTHEQLLDRLFANPHTAELKLDRGKLADRFSRMPADFAALFRALLEEFSATHGQGKPRVGEKTPLHLLEVPTLLEWFPDARVLCIVRDGRDVVLSLMSMPWCSERRLRPLCCLWIRLLRLAEKFSRDFPDRFLLLRYEDLLQSPCETLGQIDQFLGLSLEPAQFDISLPTHVVPESELTWKGLALRQFDLSRINAWKSKAAADQQLAMNALMGKHLRRMNYSDTTLPPMPFRARLANFFANLPFRLGLFAIYQKLIERNLPSVRAGRRRKRADLP